MSNNRSLSIGISQDLFFPSRSALRGGVEAVFVSPFFYGQVNAGKQGNVSWLDKWHVILQPSEKRLRTGFWSPVRQGVT